MASNTGLAVTTIIAMEAGKNVSLETLIAILRGINNLEILEEAFMQPEPLRPSVRFKLERAQMKAQRQRVRKPNIC